MIYKITSQLIHYTLNLNQILRPIFNITIKQYRIIYKCFISIVILNALYPLSTFHFVLCVVFVNAASGGMYIFVYIL